MVYTMPKLATRNDLPRTSAGRPYVVVVSRQVPPPRSSNSLYDEAFDDDAETSPDVAPAGR